MKKQAVTTLLALIFGVFLNHFYLQNINVVASDGTISTIDILSTNSIIFSNDNMQVNTSDCEDQYYSLHYTSQISFDDNVGLNDDEAEDQFEVYPNPVNEMLYVKTEAERNSTIRIYNVHGKKLMEVSVTDQVEKINVSQLPSGIYLISNNSQIIKFTKL